MKILDVVAAVIKRTDGKILLARRGAGDRFENKWEFPGGKIEENEKPQQALVREIKEELNVDISVGKIVHDWSYNYDFGKIRFLAFESKILDNMEPENIEHSEITWAEIKDLKKFEFVPADNELVAVLMEAQWLRLDL